MDDRIQQIIGRFRHKQALDVDYNHKLNLEVTTRVIKNNADKIISILNADEVFEEERFVATNYRFLGRLNIITDNTISDSNGYLPTPFDWDPLFDGTPPVTPNNWLLQVVYPAKKDEERNVGDTNLESSKAYHGIRVINIISTNPSGSRNQVGVNCVQKHNLIVGDYVYMFDVTAYSPYQGLHKIETLGIDGNNFDTSFTLETEFNVNYGTMNLKRVKDPSFTDLSIYNTNQATTITSTNISGATTSSAYTKITTVQPHGFRVADSVEINMGSAGNYILNGVYKVENIVDDNNFTIRLRFSNTPGYTVASNFKYRRMDGIPSDYYTRIFKVLTTNDYDVHKAAFGFSIYPDTINNELGMSNETWLFEFIKDIDFGPLVDHRGGPVSEFYFTTLKRAGQNTYNWSDVTAHWEFEKTTADYNNQIERVSRNVVAGVGTIEKKYLGSEYYGDFVEYNRKEIRERVITPVIHRFATNDTPNNDGYYYKPFTKVEIRKYSNEIEVALPKDNVDGIPGNFELRPNGNIEWRDLLTPGFFEEGINGTDYPFLNGGHYIFLNHFIYVRRQEPDAPLSLRTDITTINPIPIC